MPQIRDMLGNIKEPLIGLHILKKFYCKVNVEIYRE